MIIHHLIIFFSTWVDADIVDAFCGESYQCKYDYSTTLSQEFAMYTKNFQDQFINIREGVLKPEARGKIIYIMRNLRHAPGRCCVKIDFCSYIFTLPLQSYPVEHYQPLAMEERAHLHLRLEQW